MASLIVVINIVILIMFLKPHIDISAKGDVILWYGREKRDFLIIYKKEKNV